MNFRFDRSMAMKAAMAVGAGVGAYLLFKTWRGWNVEKNWVRVGTISEIVVYPVKSCKGRPVEEADCQSLGIRHGEYYDRRIVIATTEGKFLTARDAPKLVLIDTKLENGILTLVAPGKEPIEVDLKKAVAEKNVVRVSFWYQMGIEAFDCGDAAADWISDYLEKGERYRLYYHTPDRGLYNSRALNNYERWRGFGEFDKRKDLTIFQDISPFMMMMEASLEDLNKRTPNGEQFSIRNFRPNFLVEGTKPFDEDKWVNVRIGEDTSFTIIKPCTRCLLTTIDWATGEKHSRQEPLRTLRSYRTTKDPVEMKYFGGPMFGLNLALDRLGHVRVGDPVFATYKRG